MKVKKNFYKHLTTNWPYKILAMILSFPLWLSFVGQADAVLIKSVEILYVTQKNLSMTSDATKTIKIKLVGPRVFLSQLHTGSLPLTIDINDKSEGEHRIKIETSSLKLPIGVRVVEITPSVIDAKLVRSLDYK